MEIHNVMKKFLRYFIVIPLLAIFSLYLLNVIIYLTIWYFGYIRVTNLEIAKIVDTPVKINIPVKHRRDFPANLPGVRIRTVKNESYGLRCDLKKGEIFITIVRAGVLFGYMESYEITDPKVRTELIELFKKAWQEEEELRKRARAESGD